MSRVLKVDRESYYHWTCVSFLTRNFIKVGCVIKKEDTQLNKLIEAIYIQGRKHYGTRRIQDKLKDLNLKVNMKRKYKNTTNSNHNLPIDPNLLNKDFYASAPDTKYVGDITYIVTGEDWLFLATVIDLYLRKIVGWSMNDTMKVSLVNDALNMALSYRKPPKGIL